MIARSAILRNLKILGSGLSILLLMTLPRGLAAADLHDEGDDPATREQAAQRVEWHARGASHSGNLVPVKVLAINDFHGQLSAGRKIGGRPVGGAAVLVSYLKQAQDEVPGDQSFVVHSGDQIGASPPASASNQAQQCSRLHQQVVLDARKLTHLPSFPNAP